LKAEEVWEEFNHLKIAEKGRKQDENYLPARKSQSEGKQRGAGKTFL